ncbi:MAG: Flagellar assembly protein FliH/Type secretion system HrpE [Conexibacter sp.]|nr:Flagellar assembly protein FliH/Type secretion system HrpE [Conexibacter sp.]
MSSDAIAAYAFEQLEAPPPPREREDPVAAAQAAADRIREEARAAGHAEGVATAQAIAEAQLRPALQALSEAVAQVESVRDAAAAAVERDAIELALQLAEKIVTGAIEVAPERVLAVVRGALRRLVERRRVTILVNPEDLELVREATAGFITGLGGIEHCEVQSERRVLRGGAIVRTEEGQIDATVETQLERARELIALELGE